MNLSIQGPMAVGKTTALKELQNLHPEIKVSYERKSTEAKVNAYNFDKSIKEDFLKHQRIWIGSEILRHMEAKSAGCDLFDYGAEDIEFYTLNYPVAMGYDWNLGMCLKDELAALRYHRPDRILFLDAPLSVLRERKANDKERIRSSFEFYTEKMLPLKYDFIDEISGKYHNVDYLTVTHMTPKEVAEYIYKWYEKQREE